MIKRIWTPMTGYKKVRAADSVGEVIVTLRIPRFAQVFMDDGEGKCRASRAKVVAMEVARRYAKAGCDCSWCIYARLSVAKPYSDIGISIYDPEFKYELGKTVRPDTFQTRNVQCSGGIHFYRTKQEAESHTL